MKIVIDPTIPKDLLIYMTENAINGVIPSLLDIDIEEEKYFPIIIEDEDIFFHGTSQILAELIEEVGICTSRITGIESQYGGGEPFLDRIYLTKNMEYAKRWARSRALTDKSSPVIFKVLGKDINEAKCNAYVDSLLFRFPIDSIVLKNCTCIKAARIDYL